MIEFHPFKAIRYNDPRPEAGDGVLDLEGVVVPFAAAANPDKYADFLESLNPYNAYHLLTDAKAEAWSSWRKSGVLAQDEAPALYLYRIGFRDAANKLHQMSCVVGALQGVVAPADDGPADVVPMVLSIDAPGFSDLLTPTEVPLARATDETGTHHRLWAITQLGVVETIREVVAKAAVDGRLDVPTGDATRLACIGEGFNAETLPALGVVFRSRSIA